jgi:hypothetical protein
MPIRLKHGTFYDGTAALNILPHWHRKVGFLPLLRLLAELAS